MIAMDKVVTTLVGQAIAAFRANLATLVPEIFESESAANQAEITAWYGNAANTITLAVGWPQAVIQQPGIWTTLEPAQELHPQEVQGYGRFGPGMHAVPIQETVQLIVASPNQNQVLWLQLLVLWALLVQRKTLTGPPYAYQDSRLTASPLRPIPNSQSDVIFPFARAWTLTAWRMTGFNLALPPTFTAVDLTVEVNNAESP